METTKQNQEFVLIENHFGVPGHLIRATTRNRCSSDYVEMLEEMVAILYPEEEFEIYLLPSEPGSYKDIIKFVKKHKKTIGVAGAVAGGTIAAGGLLVAYLNYRDSHADHVHNESMWIVDDTQKCLALQKEVNELKEKYTIENFPEEKLKEVCGSLALKKKKNNVYSTLQSDDMIESNEITLKDQTDQVVASSTAKRNEFSSYIEPIIDQKFSLENVEGIIEIISPVVRQKQEGRGISWRGTYYGNDIVFQNISILKNGDDIDFYMQDSEFKDLITNKERVFTSDDNMKIIFTIKADIKVGVVSNKAIYISSVISFNEDIIPHKKKIRKSNNINNITDDQSTLFDNLN